MQYSDKELKKYALKLTTFGKQGKLKVLVIILLGVLAGVWLVSWGENFIEKRRTMWKLEAKKMKIEVLNATNINGLAERVAKFLRKKGFDVIRYDTAKEKIKYTVIIERKDTNLKHATFVREVLKQGEVSFEPDVLGFLEVTIVLGKDFNLKKIKK
jgi:hypothetical protein